MKQTLTMSWILGSLLIFAVAASATAGLSFQVNPFGVPAVGTGIGIYAETSGTEAVTAQQWDVTGNLINVDAPNSAVFLNDPPRVQRRQEALLVDALNLDPSGVPFLVNDSYWGDFFTQVTFGTGITGGHAIGNSMALDGGTTFGINPAPSELVLYTVFEGPSVNLSGELAFGAGALEVYDGTLLADGQFVSGGGVPSFDCPGDPHVPSLPSAPIGSDPLSPINFISQSRSTNAEAEAIFDFPGMISIRTRRRRPISATSTPRYS